MRDLNIKFNLRGKILHAIRGIDLDVYHGEVLAIVGESGSGKSVFTKSFMGLLDSNGSITSGTIDYFGADDHQPIRLSELKKEKDWLKVRGHEIAMIMQDPMTSLNPLKTIGDQIMEAVDLRPEVVTLENGQKINQVSTVTGNVIAQQRLKGIGILPKEVAVSYGVTGPSGRASGWSCDVRKLKPYGVYDKVQFDEVIRTGGDSFDRYLVRVDEIRQSLHILEQLIDNIPAGDYAVKTKPIIRLPEGQFFSSVEASRGEFGVYIESRGDKFPYRMKFRSPGLPLVSVVDYLASGSKIADLIAIGGSLDYVVPDIDR